MVQPSWRNWLYGAVSNSLAVWLIGSGLNFIAISEYFFGWFV
jgi:hypothetical protein